MPHGAIAMIDNKNGFTLIEFLVSIVILMVGLLGLLQSINLALFSNLENILRTEAVMLADDRMMAQRSKAFAAISATNRSLNVPRDIRGVFKNFSVQTVGSVVTTTDSGEPRTKQVDINVSWKIKAKRFTHSVSSIISTYPK